MGPNSDQEDDLSRIKSAYHLEISVLFLATLTRAISTTSKRASQSDVNGDLYGKEAAFVLAEKSNGDLDIKRSDRVIRLMLIINCDFAITFKVATHNKQFTALASCLFTSQSGELSETLAA